ncbi:MAG: molybdopterin converting factor subunit 1 [Hyphomicrobiales bacterium]
MKLLYFAWVRERVGSESETRDIPVDVTTVGALKTWLSSIDEGYAYAFENPQIIRVALDKTLAEDDAPLGDAQEAAFFPPMTGG